MVGLHDHDSSSSSGWLVVTSVQVKLFLAWPYAWLDCLIAAACKNNHKYPHSSIQLRCIGEPGTLEPLLQKPYRPATLDCITGCQTQDKWHSNNNLWVLHMTACATHDSQSGTQHYTAQHWYTLHLIYQLCDTATGRVSRLIPARCCANGTIKVSLTLVGRLLNTPCTQQRCTAQVASATQWPAQSHTLCMMQQPLLGYGSDPSYGIFFTP